MTTDIQIHPDKNHLNILSVLHYCLAGLHAFSGCIPLFHVSLGIAMVTGALDNGGNAPPPPRLLGVLFIAVGASMSLIFWTFAILNVIAGRCLARQVRYRYCYFVAILDCLHLPIGTALGVFTLIVLSRESVRTLFTGIERHGRIRQDSEDDGELTIPRTRHSKVDSSFRGG